MLGQVADGQVLDIIARDRAGDWLEVAMACGTVGRIASFLVDGSPEGLPVEESIPPKATPIPPTSAPAQVEAIIVITKVYKKSMK